MGIKQQQDAHIISRDYGICPQNMTKFETFWVEQGTFVDRFANRKFKTNVKIKFKANELEQPP